MSEMQRGEEPSPLELSVVAPAHNEEENIEPLVQRVGAALTPLGIPFECIVVDDGSTDSTRARIVALMEGGRHPWLRCVAMSDTPPGKGNGQSAAFFAAFRAARGRLIATLDADLQNDPADIPAMLELMRERSADFVQGDRSRNRRDNAVRRVGSIVGRAFRRLLLDDSIRDTGCSLRVFKREIRRADPADVPGHAPVHPGECEASRLHGGRDAGPAPPAGRGRDEVRVRHRTAGAAGTDRLPRRAVHAEPSAPDGERRGRDRGPSVVGSCRRDRGS